METLISSSRVECYKDTPPTVIVEFERGFEISFRLCKGKPVLVSRTGYATDAEYAEALKAASTALNAATYSKCCGYSKSDAMAHALANFAGISQD